MFNQYLIEDYTVETEPMRWKLNKNWNLYFAAESIKH